MAGPRLARWRPSAYGRAALPWLLIGTLPLGTGCRQDRPWDAPADGAVRDESQPWLAPKPDASWLGEGGAASSRAAPPDGGEETPSPVGGLWVTCYGGFHPSGQPERDVVRLGMLCGPPNGMRLLTDEPMRGEVTSEGPPATHRFRVARGECYRAFAVADGGISDLDVAIRSSRGSLLARDHSQDGWPVVHPERPFCTFEDDSFVLQLSTRRGKGRYAAQVWKLPAPK